MALHANIHTDVDRAVGLDRVLPVPSSIPYALARCTHSVGEVNKFTVGAADENNVVSLHGLHHLFTPYRLCFTATTKATFTCRKDIIAL